MSDIDARYMLGSILLSLGIVYILSNVAANFSPFWGFIGIFLIFEGSYYTVKYVFRQHKDITNPLVTLFLGITVLIFTFHIVIPTFTMLVAGFSIAVGAALLLSGFVFKVSRKEVLSGLILIGFGFLIATPAIFNISEQFYRYLHIYGVGALLILLGLVLMIPRNGKRAKKDEGGKSDEVH